VPGKEVFRDASSPEDFPNFQTQSRERMRLLLAAFVERKQGMSAELFALAEQHLEYHGPQRRSPAPWVEDEI